MSHGNRQDPLWDHLERKRELLRDLRQRQPALCAEIDRELALDFIHATNALEGNTLSREEAVSLLETGCAIGGKPLLDQMEVLDQSVALDLLARLSGSEQALRDADIRHLHAAAIGRTRPASAGRYREGERSVPGSLTTFPDPTEIDGLMGELTAWLASQPTDTRTAIEAHERLVSIQPFDDGNGRTARLLMNLILVRAECPLLVVEVGARAEYHASLEALQLGGPSAPYECFMADKLSASFQRYFEREARA